MFFFEIQNINVITEKKVKIFSRVQKSNRRSDFFSLDICRFVSVIDFLRFSINACQFLPPKNRAVLYKNKSNTSHEICLNKESHFTKSFSMCFPYGSFRPRHFVQKLCWKMDDRFIGFLKRMP